MSDGTVVWFNDGKGFGFAIEDNTEEEIFLHFSEIEMNGFRTLCQGQRIKFDVKVEPKGKFAKKIIPTNVIVNAPTPKSTTEKATDESLSNLKRDIKPFAPYPDISNQGSAFFDEFSKSGYLNRIFKILLHLHQLGDLRATYEMAKAYAFGLGVAADHQESIKLLSFASNLGSDRARVALGSQKHVFDWASREIPDFFSDREFDAFFSNFEFTNGRLFYKGNILSRDDAIGWAKFYGLMGYEVDRGSALRILAGSANSGSSFGAFSFSIIAQGGYIPSNVRNSFESFCKCAKQGVTEADWWVRSLMLLSDSRMQYLLGYAYEFGFNTPSNFLMAIYWYEKAADGEFELAKRRLRYPIISHGDLF